MAHTGAVNELDQSSVTEQSSIESSLHDDNDIERTQLHEPSEINSKDDEQIHAELIYDLPSTASAELNVLPDIALQSHLPASADVRIVNPSSGHDATTYVEHSAPKSPGREQMQPTIRPPFRVRFRSRVRIASGMHHHNHSRSCSLRRGSSGSIDSESSPCSSISAPLRYASDDADSRVSFPFPAIVKNRRPRTRSRRQLADLLPPLPSHKARPGPKFDSRERDSLLAPPSSRIGTRAVRFYGSSDPREAYQAVPPGRTGREPLQEHVDLFGPWPWRLFNGYWWAWKCGSISGCCCPADGDDDESEDEQQEQGSRDNSSTTVAET